MSEEILTSKEAAVKFFSMNQHLATDDRRLQISRALTYFHQERNPYKRDMAPLWLIAGQLMIPNWKIHIGKKGVVRNIWKSDTALIEFLKSISQHLERKYVVERSNIESGALGVVRHTLIRGGSAGATVVKVNDDYTLEIRLLNGRTFTCSPGQFSIS